LSEILQVTDLSFGYTRENLLFENLNISLKKGEVKAIVGASGAGKSTLFELILGNLEQSKGSIECHASISQVYQDPYSSFHPSYSLINQIKDVTSIDDIDRYLKSINLEYELLLKLPHELSGGQLQRASILRAILMKPSLLLLDEPTSALDNVIQLDVMKMLMDSLNDIGMLLITHDEELAHWCADEIIMI